MRNRIKIFFVLGVFLISIIGSFSALAEELRPYLPNNMPDYQSSSSPIVVHPVVHLGTRIDRQVQLFATDRVIVHDGGRTLISVWFGQRWEPYVQGRVYIVWGEYGVPIIPRFYARDQDAYIKLEIHCTMHQDIPRDLRQYMIDHSN